MQLLRRPPLGLLNPRPSHGAIRLHSGVTEVQVIDPDTGQETNLTSDPYSHQFGLLGRRIAPSLPMPLIGRTTGTSTTFPSACPG